MVSKSSNKGSWALLAPGGGFASPRDIISAWSEIEQTRSAAGKHSAVCGALTLLLSQHFDSADASLFSSGKEALYELFLAAKQATGRKYAAMGAYNCPDIAAAAVRAGLEVCLVDVSPQTLEIEPSRLSDMQLENTAAFVFSNLYGLADTMSLAKDQFADKGVLIIDDACQAALSRAGERMLGSRKGGIGLVSFGRGKALCGVGGGAVLHPKREVLDGQKILEEVLLKLKGKQDSSRLRKMRCCRELEDSLYAFCYWVLERPSLYRLPASLPFLRLGETKFDVQFSMTAMSAVQSLSALAQLKSPLLGEACLRNARLWHEGLADLEIVEPFIERGFTFDGSIVPIRYPLLFSSQLMRDSVFAALTKAGVGASKSYQKPLHGFKLLKPHLVAGDYPAAAELALRLLTLPVHSYVQAADIEKGAQIIKDTLKGRQ